MGEVGRFPLYLDVIVAMFKFYLHLKHDVSDNLFIQCALNECTTTFRTNGRSWLTLLGHICNDLKLPSILTFCRSDINSLRGALRKKFTEIWFSTINREHLVGSGKLSTYKTFKKSICFENYLTDVKNRAHAIALCKFRISAHRLKIENGRYSQT